MLRKVFCAAVSMAMLAGGAHAEQRQGAFTVSPMVGGFVFEGDQKLKDDAAFGIGIGYNLTQALGVEASFVGGDIERRKSEGGGDTTLFSYRLDALYHFMPENRLVPYAAVGVGGYNVKGDSEFMGNYGAGLLYYLTENIALRGDVRHLLITEESNLDHNLLYTAGLKFHFGGEPKRVAAPAPAPVVAAPAPLPAPAPAPVPAPKDSDNDGVADDRDNCPGTPEGVKVDKYGCPIDTDGDGVVDYLDKCPGTAKGVPVDADGCELKLTLRINFDTNQADVKPGFKEEVAKAAAFIKANSNVPYVLISGHTDSRGSEAYNQKLSEQRAEAVRQELINAHGIDGAKIKTKGFGESQPVADNDTPEGQYQNRRVEVLCCAVLPE